MDSNPASIIRAKPARCFVIMPFGNKGEYAGAREEAQFVYDEIIKPAVSTALGGGTQLLCEMVSTETGSINVSIVRKIAESEICIVDITGANPNVFFELGIRYALRKKTTILLKQRNSTIPFDITSYRCIEYSPFVRKVAIDRIVETIIDALSVSEKITDSPVYDVYPHLVVTNASANLSDHLLSWDVYWERIGLIAALLADADMEGRYNPNAILGISNGGGAYLDFLARKMNFDGPVACLWANRRNADPDRPEFISNPINNGIIDGIKQLVDKPPGDTRILLVDDFIASGSTSQMAIRFLQSKFAGCHVRFLPLFYRVPIEKAEIRKLLIWNHHGFKFDRERINSIHLVTTGMFPYGKNM